MSRNYTISTALKKSEHEAVLEKLYEACEK